MSRTVALGKGDSKSQSIESVVTGLAILFVAAAWLLPNHAQPWTTFHSDAWMALILLCITGVVLHKSAVAPLSWLVPIAGVVALIPLAQFYGGVLPFFGGAWTSFSYLVGFLLALMVGGRWVVWRPDGFGHILFGAMFVASVVSVGLQLYQWAGLTAERDLFDIWVLGISDRPYANLGQPNQLATLILWGMVSVGWLLQKRQIGGATAFGVAVYLVFGLALTQSRTGFVGLAAIAVAAWCWRPVLTHRGLPQATSLLIVLYAATSYAIHWLNQALDLPGAHSMLTRTLAEARPLVWQMFFEALAQKPWTGYGWNTSLAAHLAVVERYPEVASLYASAHNLGLDLMIWVGAPIGLALSMVLLAWLIQAAVRIREEADMLLFLLVMVVACHAMLELPLQYAYFLLPTGLVMGALSARLQIWTLGGATRIVRNCTFGVMFVAAVALTTIAYDYFQLEAATVDVRLKMARVHSDVPPQVPEVLALNQIQAMLAFALVDPLSKQSDGDLQRARDVTSASITPPNLLRLVQLLSLNGHLPEAKCWMAKSYFLVPAVSLSRMQRDWKLFQVEHPQLSDANWPQGEQTNALCRVVSGSRLAPSR